jgi:antitoxin HicB
MRIYRYTVIFEPADEGGYVVTCPALPGLVTEGGTLDGARAMAQDAIRGYWESLAEDGERHRLRMSTQQSKRLSQCPSRKDMPRLPRVTRRDVVRALKRAEFVVALVRGSHYILRHPERSSIRLTVPAHTHDLRGRFKTLIVSKHQA